jgi:hypothetical protein
MVSYSEGESAVGSPASRLAINASADQSTSSAPGGDQCEEVVGYEARHRHRHFQILRGAQRQRDVLVAKLGSEAGGVVAFFGNESAIRLIYRRTEQRVGEDIHILRAVDPRFADQRDGLSQRLDHRGDQEIAAQLDEIRLRRLIRENECPLP